MQDVFTGVVDGISTVHNANITVTAVGEHNNNRYIGKIPVSIAKADGIGFFKGRTLNNMIATFDGKHIIATVVGHVNGIPIVNIKLDNDTTHTRNNTRVALPPVTAS